MSRAKDFVRGTVRRKRRQVEAAADTKQATPSTWDAVGPHVDEALEELPDDLRIPLILHFLQGKTQTEIGNDLGIDQSTVSRRLQAGIDELRKSLRKSGIVASVLALSSMLTAHTATAVPAPLLSALTKIGMAGIAEGTAAASSAATTTLLATSTGKVAAVAVASAVIVGAAVVYRGADKPEPEQERPAAATDIAGAAAIAEPKPADLPLVPLTIEVVDEEGDPVSGARLRLHSLAVPVGDSTGNMPWDPSPRGEPAYVVTDAEGKATVRWPREVKGYGPTRGLTVIADRPGYASFMGVLFFSEEWTRIRKTVSGPHGYMALLRPDGSAPPFVLRKGAGLAVSGYLGTKDNVVAEVHPLTGQRYTIRRDAWRNLGNGRKMTSQIPEGRHTVFLAYLPEKGPVHFSDPVMFVAGKGTRHEYHLELKPGIRVEGAIDDSVPRPVRNGVVGANSNVGIELGGEPVEWWSWTTIAPDGTFLLDPMPPGEMEVIAICDGWISSSRAPIANHIQHVPQRWEIKDAATRITLTMEPTATFRARVVDSNGQGVMGARVAFWPNVKWRSGGSGVFFGAPMSSEERFRFESDAAYVKDRDERNRHRTKPFQATTDENGVAIVKNLPLWARDYAVSGPEVQQPGGRARGTVDLSSGGIVDATIRLRGESPMVPGQ